jgi:hypothetical protein
VFSETLEEVSEGVQLVRSMEAMAEVTMLMGRPTPRLAQANR